MNPEIGVTNVQVTIPVVLIVDIPTIELMAIPLLLFIVLIFCSIADSPFGDASTFTESIEVPTSSTSSTPWSVNNPVSGLTTTTSGFVV